MPTPDELKAVAAENPNAIGAEYKRMFAYAKELFETGELQKVDKPERLSYIKKRISTGGKDGYDPHIIAMMSQGFFGIPVGARPDVCLSQIYAPFITASAIKKGLIVEKDGKVELTEHGKNEAEQFAVEEPDEAKHVGDMTNFVQSDKDGAEEGLDWLYNQLLFNWKGPTDIKELRPYFEFAKQYYESTDAKKPERDERKPPEDGTTSAAASFFTLF